MKSGGIVKNKFTIILSLIIILSSCTLAKDPIKRGKATFDPNKGYPQVDISGYEELEFNKMDQSGDPKYYESTSEYKNLPASVRVYDGFRHRLLLDIEGQINPKLYIRYKILQEPDIPQETDIYVEYDKFSIYFGKYDATMNNGDLFSLNKNIDGLHADYTEQNFQIEAIYGEERSHKKEFSFSGTGKKEYSLGQTNILEGSVTVKLNNEDLNPDEYSIDYFEGKIVFNRILSATDTISGHYEYLDPIEDFLPISSKVRLAGIQHKYKMYTVPQAIFATKNATFEYTKAENISSESPWKQYTQNTDFLYEHNNFGISIEAQDLKKATLFYREQSFPLIKKNNKYVLNIPDNKKNKKILIQYETEKYSFSKEFEVEFLDQLATKNIEVTPNQLITTKATENITSTTDINIATANTSLPPTENQLQVPTTNWQLITFNMTVASYNTQDGYKISIPEGLIIIPENAFLEGTRFSLEFIPAITSLNEIEVQFKSSKAKMVKENNSYKLTQELDESFSPGLNYCYLALKYQDTFTSRKVAFYVTPDKEKQNKLERIALPNYPLVSFTEVVTVGNEKLDPGKDYAMNYEKGNIRFLKEIPVDSPLKINYTYRESLFSQETFKGTDSKGPYPLANKNIVPNSMEVRANDMYLIERDDYTVKYPEGEIIFNRKIKEVEQVVVRYKYFVIANKHQLSSTQENFDISSFFVQESAKSAESSAENSKSLSGDDLDPTSNGIVTTLNVPIDYLPLTEFHLYIDDVETENFKEKSFYNGLVVVTGSYTADRLSAEIKYGKSAYAPKENFVGNSQQTTYLNLKRPMVYGSTLLELKRANSTLYYPLEYKRDYIIGENSDLSIGKYEVVDGKAYAVVRDNSEAWERGIITFITGNTTSGFRTYSDFDSSDQFRLTYKISDSDSPDPGDVIHQTYGTKINYKPLQQVKLGLEYNQSVKRYQRQTNYAEYTTTGNGSYGQTIPLPQSITEEEIIQDSEQVFINDRLKTRNDDYSINYKDATIRLKSNIRLTAKDIIYIKYSYYTTGVGEMEDYLDKGQAVKLDTGITLPNTNINATYVTVNRNYDPVGNQSSLYTSGTEAKKLDITTKPLENLQLYAKGEQLNKEEPSNDNNVDYRKRKTTIQQYRADYKINQTDDFSLLANRTDVALPSSNTAYYDVDTTAYDYQGNLNVGPEAFRTSFYLKNAESFTDVIDKQDGTKIFNWNRSIKNTFKPLSMLSFRTALDNNIDNQFINIRKYTESKSYSELISFTPWTIDTSLELSQSEYRNEQSASETDYYNLNRTLGLDKKQVYNFTFRRPSEWSHPIWQELYFHFDDTYYNLASDLYNQKPNITRANNNSWTLRPYDLVSLGIDHKYSRAFLDNNTRDDFMQEKIYRFARIYPTKYISFLNEDFLIINKIETINKNTSNKKFYSSGDVSDYSNQEEANTLVQSYSVNPLDNLSLGFDFSEKKSKKTTLEELTSGLRKTNYNEPVLTSGMDVDYELENLLFAEQFHYQWTRDISSKQSHKTIYETTGVITKNIDDLYNLTDKVEVTYRIGSFTNKHTLERLDEFKQKDSEGSRYTYGQTDKFSSLYRTPIDGLNVSYGLSKIYNLQFTNPQKDINKQYLADDAFDDKLLRFDDTHRLTAEYTPISILSFDSSYYTRRIVQNMRYDRLTDPNNSKPLHGIINSTSYEFGSTYRPFTDFAMRYGWRRDIYDLGLGEQSKFTVEWKPAKFDLGTFTYYFENVFTYGKGINDPEQEAKMRELQGYVASSVTERNDIMVKNTLTLKINKDIANVIVDDMIADVNLTRLNFWDRINNEYSYAVNAFYAKVTLRF